MILGGIWERGGMDREGGRGTEYVVYLCGSRGIGTSQECWSGVEVEMEMRLGGWDGKLPIILSCERASACLCYL